IVSGHKGPGSCPGCHNGMDNADKTIAYTNQDGRIRLFKVTTREFLSSSIWKNPLLPKDTEPVAEIQEIAEEQLLATGSEVSNLSSTETLETRTDPIKLKREVDFLFALYRNYYQ
ncbi:Os10g0363100, partial [Oryza sativa Japonica Group]